MATTKIEWTDAVWNPIRGCTRVSEGCRNCYAERVAARFSGPGQPFHQIAEASRRWTGKVQLIEEKLSEPLHWKKPRRVFVNSMSDLFHEGVPYDWILKIWSVMADCRQHTFQILTKRPQLMQAWVSRFMADVAAHCGKDYSAPLQNVWLGVSVEDQATADERIPLLLQTPAAVRFISAEPLLGALSELWNGRCTAMLPAPSGRLLDWVICGGESGPGARPMHPDWPRTLRDQCRAAGVPFFFKQWGEWVSPEQCVCALHQSGAHGYVSDGREHSADCPNRKRFVIRVSKKQSGRLLDRREWNEFPVTR